MPKLNLSGLELHFETAGAGPPVLLLAGIASDGASWLPLLPRLNPHFRLIMLDNRGAGRTSAPFPLEIDDMVEDSAALIRHLGWGPVHVVGHSMGGMIGLRLAGRHPHLVRRLVVMRSGAAPQAKELAVLADMAELYPRVVPELWFRLLYQLLFAPPFFADPANMAAAAEASTAFPHRQSP